MHSRYWFGVALAVAIAMSWLTAGTKLPGVDAAEPAKASAFKVDRTSLPIAEPNIPHSTVLDARNAKPPARFEVKAPSEAPNVLIVLIDDMGFGMSSAFGGPIAMKTAERLAKQGLRYNQ